MADPVRFEELRAWVLADDARIRTFSDGSCSAFTLCKESLFIEVKSKRGNEKGCIEVDIFFHQYVFTECSPRIRASL